MRRGLTLLVEREAELEQVRSGLDAAATGSGSIVVIEGAPGLGKTALLERAGANASERGMTVFSARGRELERALSFGVARQLFEPVLRAAGPRERAAMLEGPARAAGDLLEGRRVEMREGDELEVMHALYWLAANLTERAPHAMFLDDLHWADRSSLAFLLYLAQRVRELPLALLVTLRPGEPGAPAELLARFADVPGARLLRLAPLSSHAAQELVRQRLPAADEAFCRACAEATGGNPFLTEALLRSAVTERIPPNATGASRVMQLAPDSVRRWTLLRLERLPAGAREVAEAVAVLGDGTDTWHVALLADIKPQETAAALDALAAADVLSLGESIQFSHPLVRAAVLAEVPESVRGERHRAAARLLAGEGASAERVAAQLLNATAVGDPWAVEQLREAARLARDRGAADSSRQYLARAAEEPPPEADRGRVLAEAAEAQALVGDPQAIDLMKSAIARLIDPRERADALYRFGWMLYHSGNLSASVEAFDAGMRECPDDDGELSARLRTALVAMQSITSTDASAFEQLERDRRSDAEAGRAEREVLTSLALARVFGTERCDEAIELATRAIRGGATVGDEGVTMTFAIAASCLVWSDALDEVEEAVERALAETRRRGTYAGAAFLMFGRSWVHYWRGQVSEAAADAGVAIEAWVGGWGGQISVARYWQALSLIELDRLDDAHAVLYAASADSETRGEDTYVVTLALARSRLALARGDIGRAREEIARAEPIARTLPLFRNPNAYPWRFHAARVALLDGDSAEARRLTNEGLDLARSFGAPRGIGAGLRTAGLIEGGNRGIELISEAVEVLERSDSTLELMRALAELGAALRRAGRRAAAREPLRRALDLSSRLGAVALRERARAELKAAGGRPRRPELTGVAALTPSERRVAELAAAGKSNPQIAQELFLSRKTVEYHLSGAYRKLHVSSREELPEALNS